MGLASVVLLIGCFAASVQSHGYLMEPPGRASAWRFGFDTPVDYNDNECYCGGFSYQYQMNDGKCGICGDAWDADPREHEVGGLYATGTLVRTYVKGQIIPVTANLTVNHLGHFEYKICANNDITVEATQECLDLTPLYGAGHEEWFLYIGNTMGAISHELQLPADLECEQCVLQWRYVASNTWGICENGTETSGCGPQEEFRGCADVSILAPPLVREGSVDLLAEPAEEIISTANKEETKGKNLYSASAVEETNEENVNATSEEVEANGENVNATGEEVATKREIVNATSKEVTAEGENVNATNEEVATKGENVNDTGEEVAMEGENVNATSDEVATKRENVNATGEEVATKGENVNDTGEEVATEGENVNASVEEVATKGENVNATSEKEEANGENVNTTSEGEETEEESVNNTGEENETKKEETAHLFQEPASKLKEMPSTLEGQIDEQEKVRTDKKKSKRDEKPGEESDDDESDEEEATVENEE